MTPLPRPDPLPAAGPSWIFSLLLLLTFFLHIIPMNLVVGGSILAGLARIRGRLRDDAMYLEFARRFAHFLPVQIAFAVSLGVAALLFAQVVYGRFLYTSSILIGWYWLSVIPILIVAYYGAYLVSFRLTGAKAAAASSVVALLFLFIAFIYANNMSLLLRPEVFLEKYLASPSGWSLNVDDPTLVPRYLHMIAGAMAVTGLFLALFGLTKWREFHEFGTWVSHRGLLLFVGATALNLVFGTWFLLSYSRDSLLRFMRGQPLGTLALALGIVFGLAALGCAGLALQAQRRLPLIVGSSATLLVTLFAMVVLRDQMRRSLVGESILPSGWIDAQWGATVLFFLLLATALAVIGWMVREFCRRPGS